MTDANTPPKQPIVVQLIAGQTYAWCRCSQSKKQPFCDGSHKGTGLMPLIFKADATKEAWLCNCKKTKTAPYCDGTHKTL